jgi:hypothetical protein
MELVRFDLQQMEQPSIQGCEYQQGTLAGYECRAYLLEKWERKCSYCDATSVPLQIEHIVARANGGTNRVSNLCLACEPCNLAKGTDAIEVFLANHPERLQRILAQAKKPLKDATAVNATRVALFERLQASGLPVECGSGGLTKFNRTKRELPKEHWLDACCVGISTPEQLTGVERVVPLLITATGSGSRQKCLMDTFGFPRTKPKGAKRVQGFATGDMVRAVVTKGKKVGTYVGKVAIRASGSFNIQTRSGTIEGISARYCTAIQRADGYAYQEKMATPIAPPKGTSLLSPDGETTGFPEAEV